MTDKLRELAERTAALCGSASRTLAYPWPTMKRVIESALREAVDKWQDIATAPKDGTHILVGRFDESIGFGYFNGKQVPAQTVAHWFRDGFYASVFGGDEKTPQPWTHWQPLPPPPGSKP